MAGTEHGRQRRRIVKALGAAGALGALGAAAPAYPQSRQPMRVARLNEPTPAPPAVPPAEGSESTTAESIAPGSSALTRIPFAFPSVAADRFSDNRAAFAAA